MKIFFGAYILLVAGVFMLWGLEPLHRAQEASSVAIHSPTSTPGGMAVASTTPKKVAAAKPTPLIPISSPTTSVSTPQTPPVTTSTSTEPQAPILLASTTPPTASYEEILVAQIEIGIHEKINEERSRAGLTPLTYSAKLASLARAHSADMLAQGYFAHNDAKGCSSSCRITASGYTWSAAGENIYMMSGYAITVDKVVDMVVKGWMESPGHKANILSDAFTEQGIGIAFVGTELYATEDFATPR